MSSQWNAFLAQCGAQIEGSTVTGFAVPLKEARAAASGTIVCDLSHLGLMQASGNDRTAFLQGQLTNDVTKASETLSQWTGHCSPKGRLLATMLLWHQGDTVRLQVMGSVLAAAHKRLNMYVLRSKVVLTDVSEATVRIGLSGPNAAQLLQQQVGAPPTQVLGVANHGGALILRLPVQRFEVITTGERAESLWTAFTADATPVGAAAWQWLDIQAGIPTLSTATQDQFVPQMVNFDALGGVNFHKGCYTGQEIVARTHYLGKVKRRMFRARLNDAGMPQSGDPLYLSGASDQAIGSVVSAALGPEDLAEILAVAQVDAIATNSMRWKSADGPTITVMSLPYPV